MMMRSSGSPTFSGADEVVIETRDGRRHVVERDGSQEAVPFGHLDAQKGEEGAW